MTFRARLSLTSLEARENPSVPTVDPTGGTAPPPTEPPPPTDPVQLAIDAAAAGAAAGAPTTPPPPIDPLLGNNSVYNVPLLP